MEIEFEKNAKNVAGALKFMCNNCKKLFVQALPSGHVSFKHVSDDQSCWLELHVNRLDVVVRKPAATGTCRAVESKLLHKAMMPITTLKDVLVFSFAADDRMRVTTTAKGATSSVDIAYMTEEPVLLDTSACCPQNCVASLQDKDIRILEKFLKRKVSEGCVDAFQHIAWKVVEDRVEVGGETAFDGIICGAAASDAPQALTFHSQLLLNLLRPTLSNTATLTLYDALPLRIKYVFGEKVKKKLPKKAAASSSSSSPSGPSETCLMLYLSPGIIA